MPDWSHDRVLRALQQQPDPVGSLVRAFPGISKLADDTWLVGWFIKLTRRFAAGKGPDPQKVIATGVGDADISLLSRTPVQVAVRMLTIRPSYFRGFRAPVAAVNLNADLVVVEGRNSSGKTSLSEAIEWVLTGCLSRRDSGQHGHPSELANCIANEFRPEGAETFVELGILVGDERHVLRRVLHRDYSRVASESPESELLLDGNVLGPAEAQALLDRLFAGVNPILMQHNLRRFVHDEPHARRQYFERLLQIDELTMLIEKAVIGPTRLRQITNPEGGTGLAALQALTAEIERAPNGPEQAGQVARLARMKAAELPGQLEKVMLSVASHFFAAALDGSTGFTEVRKRLSDAQRIDRESRLPILGALTTARAHEISEWTPIADSLVTIEQLTARLHELSAAADAISVPQQEIARIAGLLAEKGLLDLAASVNQQCPLCDDGRLTLTASRIADLASWRPLASALTGTEQSLLKSRARLAEQLQGLRDSLALAIPQLPDKGEISRQLKGASQRSASLALDAVSTTALLVSARDLLLGMISKLEAEVASADSSPAKLHEHAGAVATTLASFPAALAQHREVVASLEEAVGSASREDFIYRLRDRWLELAGLTSALIEDLSWEAAKNQVKSALDSVRNGLIALRSRLIEHARQSFSKDMTELWHLLRTDSGAQFSRIFVPEPHGKGYKLEFELKAMIADATANREVDALRVFSESQVNVVGLAAYVTRARSLGHRVLIFDDPVQSMDEEHFRSFAERLLPALLRDGFQVIIFTHSDMFARRLNEAHYERESYVTLECRSGKRHGCQVDEGNRRVSERLDNASRKAADGKLPEAWRLVRLALERLYTLAFLRSTPNFDPGTWASMSAEDMWEQGAGPVIEKAVPEAGSKLKAILGMTAAGAHDKPASSETDIQNAISYVKSLLNPLRVGAG